jgi:hypothetical protein
MSKCKIFSNSLIQGTLFDNALDVRMSFRGILSKALSQHSQSRWHIAAEVSRLSGHELSKDMLDKVCSSNFDYGLRAEDLPAVLCVIQNLDPVRGLLLPLGCEVVDPREGKFIRLAWLERKGAKLQAEIQRIRHELKENK